MDEFDDALEGTHSADNLHGPGENIDGEKSEPPHAQDHPDESLPPQQQTDQRREHAPGQQGNAEEWDEDAWNEEDDEGEEGLGNLSLDDLGAAYARAAAAHDPESFVAPTEIEDEPEQEKPEATPPAHADDEPAEPVHPEGIIEAALFVGHPDNIPLSATQLASLMRDVSEAEVIAMVDTLNDSYRSAEQALRIIEDESGGYRMTIAPAVENVRQSFLGKVREARLSQAAVEVLSLVAYQPGITAQTVQDQRGKESGGLLNQLVRRRLLEIKRQPPPEGGKKVPHYYPSERFLTLFDLGTLDDLPLVDESFLSH